MQALDHVIVEARKNGVRLLLSLVNNLQAYGGKTQYVNWAWEEGIGISSSNDSFFFDPSIHKYFKHYVKVCYVLDLTILSVFKSDKIKNLNASYNLHVEAYLGSFVFGAGSTSKASWGGSRCLRFISQPHQGLEGVWLYWCNL